MTDRAQLVPLIGALAKARVLCVGDVMLDHFHYGTVDRISPEAPIPVLKVEREDAMLGGAGNVVRNLRSLGAQARFITVVGKDGAGKEIARQIRDHGVADKPIVDDGRRTAIRRRPKRAEPGSDETSAAAQSTRRGHTTYEVSRQSPYPRRLPQPGRRGFTPDCRSGLRATRG